MLKDDKEFWRGMYNLATVGMNIVIATFIGLAMGWFLDNKLFGGKTAPWLTLAFLLFGIIAGFRNVFRITKEFSDNNPDEDDEERKE